MLLLSRSVDNAVSNSGVVVCSGSAHSTVIVLLCSSITSDNHDLTSSSFSANVTLIFFPSGYKVDK